MENFGSNMIIIIVVALLVAVFYFVYKKISENPPPTSKPIRKRNRSVFDDYYDDEEPSPDSAELRTDTETMSEWEMQILSRTRHVVKTIPLCFGYENNLAIGRSKDSDVIIDVNTISRHHAIIHQKDDRLWIIDDGSSNGVYILDEGRKKRFGNKPIEIEENRIYYLGKQAISFKRDCDADDKKYADNSNDWIDADEFFSDGYSKDDYYGNSPAVNKFGNGVLLREKTKVREKA